MRAVLYSTGTVYMLNVPYCCTVPSVLLYGTKVLCTAVVVVSVTRRADVVVACVRAYVRSMCCACSQKRKRRHQIWFGEKAEKGSRKKQKTENKFVRTAVVPVP